MAVRPYSGKKAGLVTLSKLSPMVWSVRPRRVIIGRKVEAMTSSVGTLWLGGLNVCFNDLAKRPVYVAGRA